MPRVVEKQVPVGLCRRVPLGATDHVADGESPPCWFVLIDDSDTSKSCGRGLFEQSSSTAAAPALAAGEQLLLEAGETVKSTPRRRRLGCSVLAGDPP
mmetsp:Transcript_8436/g.18949  ORF Transcript_8436/g.18949 Transcript_8436/m.18949 type:complete len:98 (+) Transcript_8436:791-1084(+)